MLQIPMSLLVFAAQMRDYFWAEAQIRRILSQTTGKKDKNKPKMREYDFHYSKKKEN